MFNLFLMLCKKKEILWYQQKAVESMLKKISLTFFYNMKDKKKIKILLKSIERVYSKNPGIQALIDESIIDVCKVEGVLCEQVFFAFLCCWVPCYGLSEIIFLCLKDSLFLVVIKKKNHVEFFHAGILRV